VRSLLRSTLLAGLVTAGLSVSLLTGAPASAATTLERALVVKINASRAASGLRALPNRRYLATKARAHSAAMARRNRLYHSDLSRICCFRRVGENVAVNYTVRGAHRSLMRSPGHRANILGRYWRGVGVGVVKARGKLWVTEIFRQSR
jgi:uncharacterized protein YkwD